MITKMKKLTFLIYHKDYECFLQNIRDLGVVHVAEKAQGTAENTELQESIRLSDHYASTIKFLQGFNVELQEQKGDTARGEKALEEVEALQLEKTQLQHQLQICDKERAALDSGKKLLDQIIVPAGTLQANQSYARVSDAANEWEVKGSSADKYVTPNTNTKTINRHAKMEKFEEHDGSGIGMAISAMSVVFCGLLLLFILFKCVGKISVNLSKRNAMKVKGITDKQEAKEKKLGEAPGEVFAAIAMAMHEMQSDVHDVEETVLTITRVKRSYSPWSSKIYTLRETPHKK